MKEYKFTINGKEYNVCVGEAEGKILPVKVNGADYEVQLEIHDVDTGKAVLTKRVYSPGYFKTASADVDETVCLFGVSEIPTGQEYRFAVRPCECFGKKGEPIYSEWQAPRAAADEAGSTSQPS